MFVCVVLSHQNGGTKKCLIFVMAVTKVADMSTKKGVSNESDSFLSQMW